MNIANPMAKIFTKKYSTQANRGSRKKAPTAKIIPPKHPMFSDLLLSLESLFLRHENKYIINTPIKIKGTAIIRDSKTSSPFGRPMTSKLLLVTPRCAKHIKFNKTVTENIMTLFIFEN